MRTMRKCSACKKIKFAETIELCPSCYVKKRRRTIPLVYLKNLHHALVQRCTNPNVKNSNIWFGKKYCTQNEFIDKFLESFEFKSLYHKCQKSGYKQKIAPSVNRKNNKGDYLIDNIEIITMHKNSFMQESTPVHVYDRNKKYIKSFKSVNEAARQLNVERSNIWKVLSGLRTHTGGYVFKYA